MSQKRKFDFMPVQFALQNGEIIETSQTAKKQRTKKSSRGVVTQIQSYNAIFVDETINIGDHDDELLSFPFKDLKQIDGSIDAVPGFLESNEHYSPSASKQSVLTTLSQLVGPFFPILLQGMNNRREKRREERATSKGSRSGRPNGKMMTFKGRSNPSHVYSA